MKSTLTNINEYCYFCYGYATQEHHLIFGKGRQFAEKYGLKVPICDACHTKAERLWDRIHDNTMAEKLSKMLGQAIFERDRALEGMSQEDIRAKFIKENGGSYL